MQNQNTISRSITKYLIITHHMEIEVDIEVKDEAEEDLDKLENH
jgi:hypothetical protein